jgi:hypothetical protein
MSPLHQRRQLLERCMARGFGIFELAGYEVREGDPPIEW